ncbi:MAG: ABC transporter ATP-binding protein [Thermoproteota archaeon]|nr:ABC transporter ATP-binding protein [Candidatus Brockarchaeota archaeon]
MSFVIECESLVKIFKGNPPVIALDNVNLKVPKGSIYGLFGPNGAGKSTLISILMGLTLPTKGSAKVLGYDVLRESLEIRSRVGLLPEGFGFYDSMTALENLKYFGLLDGIPADMVKQRAEEILEKVGLEERANAKVSTFSRGMKQRLGIAQTLLKDPEMLIFDEPTVGIDPDGVMEFRRFVQDIVKEGKTVFLSTHLLRDLGMICTHTAMIRKGRIVAQGSMEELTQKMRGAKGYSYEIRLKKPEDVGRLLQEVKKLPEVMEVRIEDEGKVSIIGGSDIGGELFSLLSRGQYSVEALVSSKPEWEDLYRFYSEGVG